MVNEQTRCEQPLSARIGNLRIILDPSLLIPVIFQASFLPAAFLSQVLEFSQQRMNVPILQAKVLRLRQATPQSGSGIHAVWPPLHCLSLPKSVQVCPTSQPSLSGQSTTQTLSISPGQLKLSWVQARLQPCPQGGTQGPHNLLRPPLPTLPLLGIDHTPHLRHRLPGRLGFWLDSRHLACAIWKLQYH